MAPFIFKLGLKKKSSKGEISIDNNNGRIRLRWRYTGTRYSIKSNYKRYFRSLYPLVIFIDRFYIKRIVFLLLLFIFIFVLITQSRTALLSFASIVASFCYRKYGLYIVSKIRNLTFRSKIFIVATSVLAGSVCVCIL